MIRKQNHRWLTAFYGFLMFVVSGLYAASPPVYPLNITFEPNQATIMPGSEKDAGIERLLSQLKKYPNAKIEVQGYADSTGTSDFNRKLSMDRAEAVRQYLIEHKGLTADQVVAVGMGEQNAPKANDTAALRQENRQVLARIMKVEEGKTQAPGTHIN